MGEIHDMPGGQGLAKACSSSSDHETRSCLYCEYKNNKTEHAALLYGRAKGSDKGEGLAPLHW